MKVLGIETATMMVGVAILDERGLVAEYRIEAARSRSERLIPMIDRVLKDSHWCPEDLGGIAISIGPGSFTGLRIGVSTAKGLAFALGLPVVGVSTLEVLASSGAVGRSGYPICPVMHAKRQEVYAALFRARAEGRLERITEEEAITPASLIEKVVALREPIFFLGTGALLYEAELSERLGDQAIFVSRVDPYPLPSIVAELGMKRLLNGEDEVSSLVPVYLSRYEPRSISK